MHKSREEWVSLIDDRALSHDFAGTEVRIPRQGEQVVVTRGRLVGQTLVVVAVRGNVYGPVQRVYVDVPGEVPTWCYPWDVSVVPD